MSEDSVIFGNFLRERISQAHMTQSAFYNAVGITKPYFYDILSGKTKPPPLDVQNRMIKELENKLRTDENWQNTFLNLAARGRQEIPADISHLIYSYPDKWNTVREYLKQNLTEQR